MREVTECIVHVINQQQPPPIEQCASASYAKRFYPSYRISPHKWSHYRFSNLNERRLVRALPITLQTLLERATLNMYRVIMTIEPGKRNTAFKRCRSFVHGLINVIGYFRGKNLIPLLLDHRFKWMRFIRWKWNWKNIISCCFFLLWRKFEGIEHGCSKSVFIEEKDAFACLKGIYISREKEEQGFLRSSDQIDDGHRAPSLALTCGRGTLWGSYVMLDRDGTWPSYRRSVSRVRRGTRRGFSAGLDLNDRGVRGEANMEDGFIRRI